MLSHANRMTMSQPPHPLCHFGMAGWFHIRGVPTAYYKPQKASPKAPSGEAEEAWPPKYWKFALTTSDGTEAAFVDFRRFGRVRLVDCSASEIRNVSPLKENGPDPVVDKDVVTETWLKELCGRRRVPIKALLLDQANISGVGNWVGDEVLFRARVHPEQYANTLSGEQVRGLHAALHYVCGLACEVLGDSSRFPEHWLFKHRWGKGKKDAFNKLPSGERIVFVTVGGRTSAVVPSVQKKTGPVAGDVKGSDGDDGGEGGGKIKKGRGGNKRKTEEVEEEDEEEEEVKEEDEVEEPKPSRRGRKSNPRLPVTDSEPSSALKTKPATNGTANTTAKRSIIKRQAETNGPAAKKGRSKAAAEPVPEIEQEVQETNGEVKGEQEGTEETAKKGRGRGGSKKQKTEVEQETEVPKEEAKGKAKTSRAKKAQAEEPPSEPLTGRRRSGRLSGR